MEMALTLIDGPGSRLVERVSAHLLRFLLFNALLTYFIFFHLFTSSIIAQISDHSFILLPNYTVTQYFPPKSPMTLKKR
jgi:hypothetical protein